MTTERTGDPLTDDQLADILRFVARICMEVERGMRPRAHLLSLMDRSQRWSQPAQLGRFPRGGPVQDGQIGHPQVSRLTDTHIIATVVTRTEGNRWGALSLRLHAKQGRWRVADVQRLLAATHYVTAARTSPERLSSPDRVLRHLTEEHRIAEAASRAANRRLDDLAPATPGYRAARDLVGYWQRKLGELNRDLAGLKARHGTRESVERMLRR